MDYHGEEFSEEEISQYSKGVEIYKNSCLKRKKTIELISFLELCFHSTYFYGVITLLKIL